MRALVSFLQANRVVVDGLEERLRAEAGLSLAQVELLARLAQAPERRLRMTDITHLLQVSKSGITRLVDRLEEAGLVARESSRTDRRLTYASLTEQGMEVLGRCEPVFAAAVDEHFSKHLTPADVSALQAAVRQILDGNGAWDEARCAPIYEDSAEEPPDDREPAAGPIDQAA
jgi:DNA-binding MarR family transcriptional regulator